VEAKVRSIMIKWEYQTLYIDHTSYSDTVKLLDFQGEKGWEVVSVQVNDVVGTTSYLFKRRKRVETSWPMAKDFNEITIDPDNWVGPATLPYESERWEPTTIPWFYCYIDGRGPTPLYCTEDQAATSAGLYPTWLVFYADPREEV
jgi:hypothetical protein